MLLEPSVARDRLTPALYPGKQGESIVELEEAFLLAVKAEDVLKKVKDKDVDLKTAIEIGILDDAEAALITEAQAAANRVIAVDDFEADEIIGFSRHESEPPRTTAKPRRVASG
jgi:acyl-CoA dehydrogenase